MDHYLKIGRAKELKNPKERIIFRFFEMLPGLFSWGIIFLAIFFSWKKPFWAAVFIISFAIYWFFRSVYFSFHLWSGYKKMKINKQTDWLKKIEKIPGFKDIYHLIVIPMYKEPFEIVQEGFGAICNSDYPKEKMIVVLACEERAKNTDLETAKKIEKEFGSRFFRFLITLHPSHIEGEIAGKGSNETWAAREAKERIVDKSNIPYEHIIFSSFDVDTCIFPKYFSCVTYHYLTSKDPTKTSFQPVPLFINNVWEAPVFSRVFSFSSTFWHTMNQERPEKLITFSSHSMSFKALVDVEFKQTNVVSDDSRIFWQCFLKNNGNYTTTPLYYPISMDANAAKSSFLTLVNIYKQQRRWAYGAGDIAYFLFGFLKNKKIPLKKKIPLVIEAFDGHVSWATASILIFMLGWLPLFLGGQEFAQTLLSYNLPRMMGRILTFAMFGLVISCYLSLVLLPPKPPDYNRFKTLVFLIGWAILPLMMIFFASLPALDAQTRWLLGRYMGFWPTEKIRKKSA